VEPTRPRRIVERSAVSRFNCDVSANVGRGLRLSASEVSNEDQGLCGVELALVAARLQTFWAVEERPWVSAPLVVRSRGHDTDPPSLP
jgi:hypothetical protein